MKTSIHDTSREVIHSCIYFIVITLKGIFVLYGRRKTRKVLRNNGFAIVVISSQPCKMFCICVNDDGMGFMLLSNVGLFVQETGSKPCYALL